MSVKFASNKYLNYVTAKEWKVKPTTTSLFLGWLLHCKVNHVPIKCCCFLPAEVLRGTTGSGSEAPSNLGVKPGTTAVAVLISRSRLLTPWVDSFHRLPMPCVDSLRRLDTEGPPPRVTPPFRSLLSMLMANRMEFRPEKREVRWNVLHNGLVKSYECFELLQSAL